MCECVCVCECKQRQTYLAIVWRSHGKRSNINKRFRLSNKMLIMTTINIVIINIGLFGCCRRWRHRQLQRSSVGDDNVEKSVFFNKPPEKQTKRETSMTFLCVKTSQCSFEVLVFWFVVLWFCCGGGGERQCCNTTTAVLVLSSTVLYHVVVAPCCVVRLGCVPRCCCAAGPSINLCVLLPLCFAVKLGKMYLDT